MRKFYVSFLMVALVMCAVPTIAHANTTVAVVNVQQLLKESLAAQSIESQLKKKTKTIQDEFAQIERDLKKQEQELVKKKETLSAEDFTKERKEFEKKLLETGKLAQQRRRALDKGFADAINELRNKIVDIVAKMAEEKKYNIVVSRQNVVIVEKNSDITFEVMKKLNSELKTIALKVEK